MRKDNRDFEHLTWLVERRNAIQKLMLNLYEQLTRPEPDEAQIKQLHLMVGAAFSLWRAVFLLGDGEGARSMDDIHEHAEKFLEKVIRTNSITFADDRDTKMWSAGYYVNNANYRLRALGESQIDESISNKALKQAWDDAHEALSKRVSDLSRA